MYRQHALADFIKKFFKSSPKRATYALVRARLHVQLIISPFDFPAIKAALQVVKGIYIHVHACYT